MRRATFRPTAVACALSLLLGTGCARLVALDPETVASRNDAAWRIRSMPVAATPLAAAPSPAAAPPLGAAPLPPDATLPPAAAPAPVVGSVGAPAAAAPEPVASAPSAPLPFRGRPQVQAALLTPPDALGIPTGLYAVDPLLTDYRREMDAQASARHAVATGTIVLGVIFAGLSVWAIAYGGSHTDSSNSQASADAAETLVYGAILGAFSFSEIIGGLVLATKASDSRPLERYYRETYAAPR